ncbi:hypothetical protein OKW24_002042 [Peribacillus simplex]|nr:hypothetical protein [Peribacillus simplex]MDF9760269.1 hypothetical protein [Peribacillus simplex]
MGVADFLLQFHKSIHTLILAFFRALAKLSSFIDLAIGPYRSSIEFTQM